MNYLHFMTVHTETCLSDRNASIISITLPATHIRRLEITNLLVIVILTKIRFSHLSRISIYIPFLHYFQLMHLLFLFLLLLLNGKNLRCLIVATTLVF